MNDKLPDPTRRPLSPQAPKAPLGPKPVSTPPPIQTITSNPPTPPIQVAPITPPTPITPPAPMAPPAPPVSFTPQPAPTQILSQQTQGFGTLNTPTTRPLSPPPTPISPPTPPVQVAPITPPTPIAPPPPMAPPAPPAPIYQNKPQTPQTTQFSQNPSPLPPPTPPPAPPQESPTFKGDKASTSDVKKSPFRFLIPLIVVLLVAVIGFAIFSFFGQPKTTTNNNPNSQIPANGSQNKGETKQVEIVYWGLWEPSTVLESVFAEFEQSHQGTTIKYTQQSPKDYRERLQSALARGEGPDVFRFHNTWVPMLSKELDSLPETIMSVSEYQSTFYPVMSSDLRSSKSFYGIPFMFEGLGLYYNKKIFDDAGKTPPKTWEELRTLASELTIKNGGVIQRAGVALGTAGNVDNYSDILGLMLLQNGADPANPTTSLASDALTFYTIFSTIDGVWDDTLPASTFAFATEKVAMIIAPSWRAHEIRDINPDLQFAIAPVPQLPSSKITWASYWAEGVSTGSKNKQISWELLDFLSSKEVMRKLYTQASSERLFGEPFSRVDMAEQLLTDPYVGAYISGAPDSQSWYLSSRTFDNGLNDRIIKYYEDAINSVNSGKESSDALETTAQGVTQIISQYSSSK